MTKNTKVLNEEIVKYDKVYTNVGNGYNTYTGIFLCPEEGTYMFSLNGLAPPHLELYLSLYKNSEEVITLWGSVGSSYASASNSVILPLKKGDNVYIKAKRNFELFADQF